MVIFGVGGSHMPTTNSNGWLPWLVSKPALNSYPEGLHYRAILGANRLSLDSNNNNPDTKAYMQVTYLQNDPRMQEMQRNKTE